MVSELNGRELRGYQLLERIGTGGFGEVFRAFQPAIDREVAIKIILPRFANQTEFIRRFEAEAQVIARLEHFHIVTLYDYWRDPNGAYLVMRYLRGGSLRDLIDQGSIPLDQVGRIVEQTCSALIVAHQKRIIHRDIKPDNILLDEERNAYLADFGIAKAVQSQIKLSDSEPGIIGSPAYISPEIIGGQAVTHQTDIYSFGIMLYEMLTGQVPFEGTNVGTVLIKHMSEAVPTVLERRPDLSPAFDVVIQRATEKDPDNRYSSLRDLMIDFRKAMRDGMGESADSPRRTHARSAGSTTTIGVDSDILSSDILSLANPYKGLRAFEEADSSDFFGRSVLIDQLMARLSISGSEGRFLAVVGPSGSGKSSVVKAGLLPRLRKRTGSARWFIVEMNPGTHPLRELAEALLKVAVWLPGDLLKEFIDHDDGLLRTINKVLPEPDTELLLVVDQFEELFTQVENERLRQSFLDNLMNAVRAPESRLRVIITLRADFYDKPLLYPEFGTLIRAQTEVVLPLLPEELEEAIVGPAERVGLVLEAGLVSAIVQDVGTQSGALPLLQYALTELYERRQGRLLTLQAYYDSGGVLGALARRAEELFSSLDEPRQQTARQMFLRLVSLGEGTDDTRRRVLRSELTSLAGERQLMEDVIDTYGKYRLLTFDHDPLTRQPQVEVAHEALIRQWERMQTWLEDAREDLHLQRRLSQAAVEWQHAIFDPSYLASGSRLTQFEEFVSRTDLALDPLEIQYFQNSLQRRTQQQSAEAERIAREKALEDRSRNRLRLLVALMSVAAAVAVFLTIIALNASETARVERDNAQVARATSDANAELALQEGIIAKRNAEEARSLALASAVQVALRDHNTDLAIVLAMEANTIENPPQEAQRALAESAYNPGTLRVMTGHEGAVRTVAYSPDGSLALTGGDDGAIILWDMQTQSEVRRFIGHFDPVNAAIFMPDQTSILSGGDDYAVRLWDLETGAVKQVFGGHSDTVTAVAASPQGNRAASASADGVIIVWDMETGRPVFRLEGHEERVNTLAFGRNGRFLLSGGADDVAIVWDMNATSSRLAELLRLQGHTADVLAVDFSTNSSNAISASADNTLILWSTQTGVIIRRFEGHSDWVNSVAFSPDGQRILSGSQDSTMILWEVGTGAALEQFVGHGGGVLSVDFSPDGQRFISGSSDASLRLWSLQSSAQISNFRGHGGAVYAVAFSADGKQALSGAADNLGIVWEVASGKVLHNFIGHSGWVRAVDISPDGRLGITGSDDETIRVWDMETAKPIFTLEGHIEPVRTVAFSPDGRFIASGSNDSSLILWDVATGEEVRRFGTIRENTEEGTQIRAHDGWVRSVAFSHDGTRLISGGSDSVARVWDLRSGDALLTLEGHRESLLSTMYNHNDSRLLTTGTDGQIILWDAADGREINHFIGHNGPVFQAGFSPDDAYLYSGSGDGTIRIWQISNGEEIRRYAGHGGGVQALEFSPSESVILSGGGDALLRLWRVDYTLQGLMEWTRENRYLRELSCEEREIYRILPLCDVNQ